MHDDNVFHFQEGPVITDSGDDFHEGPVIKDTGAGSNFEYPSDTSNNINVQDFLEENGQTLEQRFFFGGNREGAACTTPTG